MSSLVNVPLCNSDGYKSLRMICNEVSWHYYIPTTQVVRKYSILVLDTHQQFPQDEYDASEYSFFSASINPNIHITKLQKNKQLDKSQTIKIQITNSGSSDFTIPEGTALFSFSRKSLRSFETDIANAQLMNRLTLSH